MFAYSLFCNVYNVEVSHNVVNPIIKTATRHVSAPEPKAPQSAPNQNICADCERLIM